MNKLFTFLTCVGVAASLQIQAQSQRLVMIEEFTNASCPPCAAQNPAFNTLLGNNLIKAVSIKYQTNWPGVDPMNAQTQADVAPRVTYYAVSGVPYSPMDGVAFTGSSYVGAPANATQAKIDAAYAIPATHDIVMTHSFTADYDSVFITMNITCTVTGTGTLKARVGLIEKEINFTAPPGTNGETDFEYVMRKMYPNAAGTTVTADTLGETQVITLAGPTPAFTYNISQLAVVGFIQNDANKNVRQAAFSAVILPQNLAKAEQLLNLPVIQCDSTVAPNFEVANVGTAQLTNCTIKYKIDNTPEISVPWTCNIAPGATQSFPVPSFVAALGTHTLKVTVSEPNGFTYAIPSAGASSITKKVSIIGASTLIPYAQAFATTVWPPAGWVLDSEDGTQSWSRRAGIGATGSTSGSAKIDFYNSTSGQSDYMYITPIDMTGAISPASLDFKVAHRQYSALYSDSLFVSVSTDCGATWSQEFVADGPTLSTVAGYLTSAFTPTATQWRSESINLDNYIGQTQLLVQFKATSDYGNNAYVDDINFHDATLGVKDLSNSSSVFSAYQSSANYMNVKLNLDHANEVVFEVYDIIGKVVYKENKGRLNSGDQSFAYSIANLNSGIYVVRVTAGTQVLNQKVTINK
jgi:hypothetical protein